MKDGEALVFSLVRAGRGHHLPGFCPQKLQGDDSSPRATEGKVFCPSMLRLPPASDSTLPKPPSRPPELSTGEDAWALALGTSGELACFCYVSGDVSLKAKFLPVRWWKDLQGSGSRR